MPNHRELTYMFLINSSWIQMDVSKTRYGAYSITHGCYDETSHFGVSVPTGGGIALFLDDWGRNDYGDNGRSFLRPVHDTKE